MPLERSVDFGPAEWIGKARLTGTDQREGWLGVPVRHCLPAGFGSYAKVFHPIFVDASAEDRELGSTKGKRVSMRELAQRYDLEFHPEISDASFSRVFPEQRWPRYLIRPNEGHLDDDTCCVLMDTVGPFTRQQRCWFYYSGPSINPYEPRLYSGDLLDIMSLPEQEGIQALPEYWWPEDHAWCINSDWDLSFTLFGGPSELVRLAIEHSSLEAIPVTLSTRVDSLADMRNARRRIRQLAELVIADRMSLSVAARAMGVLWQAAGSDFETALASFVEIERETNSLPIGSVRAHWAPEALESKDADIHRIETAHRARTLQACRDILLKADR